MHDDILMGLLRCMSSMEIHISAISLVARHIGAQASEDMMEDITELCRRIFNRQETISTFKTVQFFNALTILLPSKSEWIIKEYDRVMASHAGTPEDTHKYRSIIMMALSGATRAVEILDTKDMEELVSLAWTLPGLVTDPQGISVILNCMTAANIRVEKNRKEIEEICFSPRVDSHSFSLLVNSFARLDKVDLILLLLHVQQDRMDELICGMTEQGKDVTILALSSVLDILSGVNQEVNVLRMWIESLLETSRSAPLPERAESIAQRKQAYCILEFHGYSISGREVTGSNIFGSRNPIVSKFHSNVLDSLRTILPLNRNLTVNLVEPKTGYEIDICLCHQ